MKKILVTMVAALLATMTYAQSSMLATLSHNGEISTFYGTQALVEAYNAADHGDVITLSSGMYTATDIKKAITLRGAGMAIDSTAQTQPTVLVGDIHIAIPDTITQRLTIEGIYHNNIIINSGIVRNAAFIKCRFNEISYENAHDPRMVSLSMLNCFVAVGLKPYPGSSIFCENCVINNPQQMGGDVTNFNFHNCIVMGSSWNVGEAPKGSVFSNCVIVCTGGSPVLRESNTAYNCVSNQGAFEKISNKTNTADVPYSVIFKTFRGTYSDSETYELTDEAKTKYLGLDGTQVGIYGGDLPFSSTPSNPRIVQCKVASKSSADGTLSVDIKVESAE